MFLPIFYLDCFWGVCVFFFPVELFNLYILDIGPLSDMWFANIFSQYILSILLIVSQSKKILVISLSCICGLSE